VPGPRRPLTSELLPVDVIPAESLGERVVAAVAWGGLLAVDLFLRVAGFERFYKALRDCPTLGRPPKDPDAVLRICAAVDRAATYYFKHAWCLQRSAAAVCLLRLRGVAAELVIGVRKMPFAAHAWVEVDGQVLNNSPIVKESYVELDRC
jgi:transglutaminase-like putative cysteine protease